MSPDPNPSRDALALTGTLLQTVRIIDHRFRRAGDVDDLGLTDLSVLRKIAHGVDMVTRIAPLLHLDKPRVSRICAHLESLGYVERRLDEGDRRCWRLRLTPAGESRLHEGLSALRAVVGSILNGLETEDRAALTQGLLALQGALDIGSAPNSESHVTHSAAGST